MQAKELHQHIQKTRSTESLAEYCRVATVTAYNWMRSGNIPDKYAKYVIERIEINNDKWLDVCDTLQNIINQNKKEASK